LKLKTGVVVGMCLLIGGLSAAETQLPDHGILTAVLQDHVTKGRVDYAAIARDKRLADYLEDLARTDPVALPSQADRLAFWINAYNAYTLKLVADAYPIDSIHDLSTGGRIIGWLIKRSPWDIRFAEIGGKDYTLNEIEHEVIRKRFNEPRIHFAIVCAAISCPPLRSEAYLPEKLGDQLDEQTRQFLNDRRSNRFDFRAGRAWLSPIFSWFEEDFGASDEAVMAFVARYLDQNETAQTPKNEGRWKVEYTDYDWSLNERP